MVNNCFNFIGYFAIHLWEFTFEIRTIKVCFLTLFKKIEFGWYIRHFYATKVTIILDFARETVLYCFVILIMRIAGLVFAFKLQVVYHI